MSTQSGTTEDGESIVFLHPVSLDAHAGDWLTVDGLLTPSLLGHGPRARIPGVTLADMADDIATSTNGRLHLIGCSMGGMVALQFALRYPERVASLFLAYTTARADPEIMHARAEETERIGSADMADPTMHRWFTEAALTARTEAPVAYARERLISTPAEVIADDWRAIAGHDVQDRLGELAGIPSTCLAGRLDLSTPMTAVEAIAEGIPGSRLVVMEHPHMGFLELPREFSSLVNEHLDWARSTS